MTDRHEFISEADDLSRRTAATIAGHKAADTGISHIVVRQDRPRKYLVFPSGDAALSRDDLIAFYELTPEGACIKLGGGWSISEFIERGRAAQAAVDSIIAAQKSRRKP